MLERGDDDAFLQQAVCSGLRVCIDWCCCAKGAVSPFYEFSVEGKSPGTIVHNTAFHVLLVRGSWAVFVDKVQVERSVCCDKTVSA